MRFNILYELKGTRVVEVIIPKEISLPDDWDNYTNAYRDWETDRKSTRLNSSHRL